MKTLAIIREHEVFTDRRPAHDASYEYVRQAVRVFLFDEEENVAVLYYPPKGERVNGEYLLVGGGVEEGETFEEALRREAREEAGCEVHLIEELGLVKQYGIGSEQKRIQDEYFYKAFVKGDKGETSFDQREKVQSVELRWVSLEDLTSAIKQQRPSFGRTNTLIVFKEFFGIV